jgi:uncharacterized protein (TIGR01244 family)
VRKLFFLLALVSVASCADEEPASRLPQVHVDVAAISSPADLVPVDGLRSAGQPDAAQFRAFAEAGYVAVIDIRGADEDRGLDEAEVLQDLGLEYVTLPIVGDEAISYDNARKLDALLARYDEPVLVHCGSGNRVGALLALRENLEGASSDEALEYGRNAGLSRLEPVVRQRLREGE